MLHLFPPGLDSTLLVPVLLGLLVMIATTEWWGWDFVGVVVPGYLCSVLVLQPAVAGVVVVEACLTYGLVKGIEVASSRSGLAFPVFGRDRFYLVLTASVGVRLLLEGFALQKGASLLQARWPGIEAYRSELFGLGVVLVPLIANRLWRPGLRRGLFQLTVHTGVALLIVALLLVPYTNFSIGGFELAYDQLALAFLSSPRTQVALLVTAAVASEFNRRYGWDFHGILVPALLALAVVTPLKLVTTLLEAGLIVVTAKLVLRLPTFRNANIEGARRLLLCFGISFVAKVALAAVLSWRYAGFRPSDFFGMGYLLPSLLAERILIKDNVALVLLPTLQTALLGAIAAIGLLLALGTFAPSLPTAPEAAIPVERYHSLSQAVASLLPVAQRGAGSDLALLLSRVRSGKGVAESMDGYRIAVLEGTSGLVALREGSARPVAAAFGNAEQAALAAVARGASLVLAATPDQAASLPGLGALEVDPSGPRSPFPVVDAPKAARPLALEPAGGFLFVPPDRALAEAAHRIARARVDDAAQLALMLGPLGVSTLRSGDGVTVLRGPGWPTVALAATPRAVVVAPHSSELEVAQAALFAAAQLSADCVLPSADSGALELAVALAQASELPLLILRGSGEDEVDARLLLAPEMTGLPGWLGPLLGPLQARFELSRDAGPPSTVWRAAFPARAGRASSTAVLWLSRRARTALGGGAFLFTRPGLAELGAERGVISKEDDLAKWVTAGAGEPPRGSVALAERLVRSGDVALLRAPQGGAKFFLLTDERQGLTAVGVEAGARRAVVIAGERTEAHFQVRGLAEAQAALAQGARVLLAGEAVH